MFSVCTNGSSEKCTKAVETAQRAENVLPREQLRSFQAAVGLPGTLVGGPLPTSIEDIAGNELSDLVTGALSSDPKAKETRNKRDNETKKKRKEKEKEKLSGGSEPCQDTGDSECAQ